jgi:hypothetical protein
MIERRCIPALAAAMLRHFNQGREHRWTKLAGMAISRAQWSEGQRRKSDLFGVQTTRRSVAIRVTQTTGEGHVS